NIKSNFTNSEEIKIEIYNTLGQLVLEQNKVIAPNAMVDISTSPLGADVYIVKVTTSNGKQFTNRVVVAK
ncbi:MAG TPA: T9SS sorting signal type C domain-containing protein, partial [Bacteroidia bacterium]